MPVKSVKATSRSPEPAQDRTLIQYGSLGFAVHRTKYWDLVQIERDGFFHPTILAAHPFLKGYAAIRPVIFYGNAPTWLYGHLVGISPNAPWVACGDAVHGAVVVRSQNRRFPLGHIIPAKEILPHLPVKVHTPKRQADSPSTPSASSASSACRVVAVVGPPHSGKTVFLSALLGALREQLSASDLNQHTYFIGAAPDGEGKFSQRLRPKLAEVLRRKGIFTKDFAHAAASRLRALRDSKRLVVADLGGRIDDKQLPILSACTHVLIVSRDPSATAEWRGAADLLGLPVLCVVESVRRRARMVLSAEPLVCRIGPFERGAPMLPRIPAQLVNTLLGGLFPLEPRALSARRSAPQ